HRLATILSRPVVTHWESVLVSLSSGLSIERKIAHFARAASLHLLSHARVCHDELPFVEHIVADQIVEKLDDRPLEFRSLAIELINGVGQSVRQLHIASLQFPHQLHVMIAGNAERGTVFYHFHDQVQYFWNLGSAVNQDTNENRLASIWRSHTLCRRSFVDLVTEPNEQSGQLFVATVHVPDDVERPMLVFQVIPKGLSHDRDRGGLLGTRQHEDMTEAFAFKSPKRTPQLLGLVSDDVRAELAVRPTLIAFVADLLWQVQNDRHGQNMKLASERH